MKKATGALGPSDGGYVNDSLLHPEGKGILLPVGRIVPREIHHVTNIPDPTYDMLKELIQDSQNPDTFRPSKQEIFMRTAHLFSHLATCPRRKVGCVLVSPEGYVLATGYNGAPANVPHCTEVGCKEDSYGHCSRSVHAEINAITQAARRGTHLDLAIAYVTLAPCLGCVKAMIQAGIQQIFYEEDYPANFKEVKILHSLLGECGVRFEQLVPS